MSDKNFSDALMNLIRNYARQGIHNLKVDEKGNVSGLFEDDEGKRYPFVIADGQIYSDYIWAIERLGEKQDGIQN